LGVTCEHTPIRNNTTNSSTSNTRGLDIGLAALRTVLEQIAEGYIVTDTAGCIVEVNAAAGALLGHHSQVLTGSVLSTYLPSESAAALDALIAHLHDAPPPPGEEHSPPWTEEELSHLCVAMRNNPAHAPVPRVCLTPFPEHDRDLGLVSIHWLATPEERAGGGPPEAQGGSQGEADGRPPEADQEGEDLALASSSLHEVTGRLRAEANRTRGLLTTRARLLAQADELIQTAEHTFTATGQRYAQALGSHTGFLEHLTQTAEIAITILDASDYRFLYANPFMAKSLGSAGEHILGHRVTDLLGAQAGKDIIAMLERARATNKALHIHEYEAEMAPGQPPTFWDVEVLPVSGEDTDEVTRLVVVGHNITALVHARREAARLAAQKEAILDSLTEGVFVADLNGSVITLNPAARAYLGLSEGEAAPATLAELNTAFRISDLAGRVLSPAEWPIARTLRDKVPVTDQVLRVVEIRTDREWIGSCGSSLVLDASGTPYLAVFTFRDITDRINAERARARLLQELDDERERLSDERARLRAILDALPVGVFITDTEGRIIEGNSYIDTIMGGAPPLVERGQGDQGLWSIAKETLATRDPTLALALRQGVTTRGQEIEIVRLDGRRGVVLNAVAPIIDAAGMRIGAVAAIQDITELREAREKQHRLTERLAALRDMDRAVLEAATIEKMAASALPWLRDALGCALVSLTLFDLSRAGIRAYTVTGIPANGGTRLQHCHQAQLPLPEQLGTLLRQGPAVVEDTQSMEQTSLLAPFAPLLQPVGVRAFTAVPLATRDHILGALVIGLKRPGRLDREQLAIAQEVAAQFAVAIHQSQLREEVLQHTARMELRVQERTAELQASQARFRAIYEDAAIGIAVIDLDGYILQVNPAGLAMIERSEDELIGTHFGAFSDPNKREHETAILSTLAGGEMEHYRGEEMFRRKDGREIWTRLTVSLVRDAGGAPSFIFAMVEDVTVQRETQEALRRAEKLTITGQLAASLAHEVGNPLQTIVGCLGLARESVGKQDDSVRRHLEMASGEAHRAAGIVRQLRDLNRPTSSQDREPVDIAALVEKVLALGEPQARYQEVDLVVIPPAGALPAVTAVADQLHQVFLNLVLNALEAMPEGGRLEVRLERTDAPDGVMILFEDTGPGVVEEITPHLFEPFQTTKEEGLGLGLYVTHSLVETHGGTLSVESTPGKGASFRVWLPATG
jgi:PAS domain S-box-containing protein